MSIELSELLSAHADQLNRRQASADLQENLAPEQRGEIISLMNVAAQVKGALPRVHIAPGFRARLHDGLTMAARHQESQRILFGRRDSSWGWVIGAAALGSAAGLIAIAWRARRPSRPQSNAEIAPKVEASVASRER